MAVDVTAREDVRVDPRYLWPPSAWRILWSRLNPFAQRIQAPGIYKILLRTTMLESACTALTEWKPDAGPAPSARGE